MQARSQMHTWWAGVGDEERQLAGLVEGQESGHKHPSTYPGHKSALGHRDGNPSGLRSYLCWVLYISVTLTACLRGASPPTSQRSKLRVRGWGQPIVVPCVRGTAGMEIQMAGVLLRPLGQAVDGARQGILGTERLVVPQTT